MSSNEVVCVFVMLFIALSKGKLKQLPPYIIACRIDDPNINECFRERANEVLPKLKNGDKAFKLPPISPLRVNEAIVRAGGTLNIIMKDFDITGLDDLKVLTADVTFIDKVYNIKISASTPYFKVIGNYEANGRMLILPITGKGKSNVTFENVIMTYDLKAHEAPKKDIKVLKIDDIQLTFDATRIYILFENLFGGDKRLGREMNKFMNENWKEIFDEVRPSFSHIVQDIIYSYVKQVIDNVPVEKVFTR